MHNFIGKPRRLLRLFCLAFGVIPALPLALVVLSIRPFIWVRFGFFYADRIGHLVNDSSIYLALRKNDCNLPRCVDLFFLKGKVCNGFWIKYLKRQCLISPLIEPLFLVTKRLPFGQKHLLYPFRDTHGYGFPKQDVDYPVLDPGSFQDNYAFTDKDNNYGKEFLHKIGVEDVDRVVCLNVRDARYLESNFERSDGGAYHSYRNSDIRDYEPVARWLAEKGYTVLRMGKAVERPFVSAIEGIFDYSNSTLRSDFLDVWLSANCRFMVSTGSGIDAIATTFDRSVAFVNAMPLIDINYWANCVWAPKHLAWKASGEKLTLAEHINFPFNNTKKYDSAGLLVQDLTSDEITETVFELVQRLDNTFEEDSTITQKQEQFWELFFSTTGYRKTPTDFKQQCFVSQSFIESTKLK